MRELIKGEREGGLITEKWPHYMLVSSGVHDEKLLKSNLVVKKLLLCVDKKLEKHKNQSLPVCVKMKYLR